RPLASPGGAAAGSPAPRATGEPPSRIPAAAPTGLAAATPAPAASANGSLNDRLRGLLPHGTVDYTPRHVDLGARDDFAKRIEAAWEVGLAPPADVLARTFGIIWAKRTAVHADSITYVFARTTVLGVPVCKAYRITEHPYGAGAPDLSKNPIADTGQKYAAPETEIVTIVPCSEKSYEPIVPGSLQTPAPRRRP
ncbi:MAG: hypothetical protein WCE44_10660, partial [Candidatus Velthaea sp.]